MICLTKMKSKIIMKVHLDEEKDKEMLQVIKENEKKLKNKIGVDKIKIVYFD